jgi:hypothetical protein
MSAFVIRPHVFESLNATLAVVKSPAQHLQICSHAGKVLTMTGITAMLMPLSLPMHARHHHPHGHSVTAQQVRL